MAKWVYKPGHPKANDRGFVAWEDYGDWTEERALDAPILSGRFYENVQSPIDGSDIGSRTKHREHMKQHNVTIATDYAGEWEKAKAQREAMQKGEHDTSERKEAVERAWYERNKP